MKVRKFFAPSSREALKMVRAELGADAVVLSNRVVDGGVELVALTEDTLSDIVDTRNTRDHAAQSQDAFADAPAAGRQEPMLHSAPQGGPDDGFTLTPPAYRDASDMPREPAPWSGMAVESAYGQAAAPDALNDTEDTDTDSFFEPYTASPAARYARTAPSLTPPGAAPLTAAAGDGRRAQSTQSDQSLPGGFARRPMPSAPAVPAVEEPRAMRRFEPREDTTPVRRSRPIETRDEAIAREQAAAREARLAESSAATARQEPRLDVATPAPSGPVAAGVAARPPLAYRPPQGTSGPLMHAESPRDRTRALPGVLAAKEVKDDGASALAYVHRAAQTAYLNERRARAEAAADAARQHAEAAEAEFQRAADVSSGNHPFAPGEERAAPSSAPMSASEAMALGLGSTGDTVVPEAFDATGADAFEHGVFGHNESDRLSDRAMAETAAETTPETSPETATIPAALETDASSGFATESAFDSAAAAASAAEPVVTATAPALTDTTPAIVAEAHNPHRYGTPLYSAQTRVKASFASMPMMGRAVGDPTGALQAAQILSSAQTPVAGNGPAVAAVSAAHSADAAPVTDGAASDERAEPMEPVTAAPAMLSVPDLNWPDQIPAQAATAMATASIASTATPDLVELSMPAPVPAVGAGDANANDQTNGQGGAGLDHPHHAASKVLDEMRSLCGALGQQLEAIDQNERARQQDPARAALTRMLLACGFSVQLVGLLLEKLPAIANAEEGLAWVKATFERNLPVLDNEDALMEQGGVFALMGPTGVGKTTTTAKLAARAVMRHGADRVALLTTDSYRIGAHEQLRIYGRILGVAVHAVKDASDLSLVLSELRNKHMVLIDTIGMSQRDRAVSEQLAMLRGTNLPVKRLLLLNATSHGDTLNEVVRAYGEITGAAGTSDPGLTGCIITKVDEANGIGAALDTVMRHRLPVHYVSNGQKVPEDLRVARRGYLIDNAFSDPHRTSPFHPDAESLAMLFSAQRPAAARAGMSAGSNDLNATSNAGNVGNAVRQVSGEVQHG